MKQYDRGFRKEFMKSLTHELTTCYVDQILKGLRDVEDRNRLAEYWQEKQGPFFENTNLSKYLLKELELEEDLYYE